MNASTTSPKIQSIEWGKVVTEDGDEFKDAKLFPGGSRTWDWNETGTHHSPGIQPADVDELLDHGAEKIVLSQGFHARLQVMEKTKKMLHDNGIEFFVMETGKAVEKYNQLSDEAPTAALIHSTC